MISLISFWGAKSQSIGFDVSNEKKPISIPFEYYNNFILVDVTFNNTFPLKFIFDTGAEHTVLTKKQITELLALPYGRSFTIMGSDMQTELTAHLLQGIQLKVGDAIAKSQDILVLEDDYFQFEEFTGTEVHGILGADLFRRFVVKINYQRQVISLYNPKFFQKPNSKKFKEIDIRVYKNKPYLNGLISLQNNTSIDANLLIDTGASLSLLLNTYSHPDLNIPETVIKSNIGSGLGGFLEGYTGRIAGMQIDEFQLTDIVTSFQEETHLSDSLDINYRNGIVGNEILSRFSIIIDYIGSKLYLRPNRKLKDTFKYDRSGLTLITAGPLRNTMVVRNIAPDSPAADADILRGDIVKAINGVPIFLLSLKNVNNKLRARPGKKIKLKLKRIGYTIRREFVLKDLI